MFLNAEQLRGLTGSARKEKQIKWLKHHRYPFDLDDKGRPVVLRSYVEGRLGGTISSPTGPQLRLSA